MAGIGRHKPLPPPRNTIRPQLRKARTLEPRQNGSSRETTSTISIQHARLGAYPTSRRAYLAVVCTIGRTHGRKASGQETHDTCNPAIIRHRQHDRNSSHPPITGRRHTQLRDTVKTNAENHHKPRPALDGAGIPQRPTPYATNTFTIGDYRTMHQNGRSTIDEAARRVAKHRGQAQCYQRTEMRSPMCAAAGAADSSSTMAMA